MGRAGRLGHFEGAVMYGSSFAGFVVAVTLAGFAVGVILGIPAGVILGRLL